MFVDKITLSLAPGCPFDSALFDPTEFASLNHAYGPITYDACAYAFDNVCPSYSSTENPFTSASTTCHTVFINPVFDDTTLPILQHLFEQQQQQSPADVHAILILQRWHSPVGKSWLPILSKYKRTHSYPAGTYLFHFATCATASTPIGPLGGH
jgi:hypothetical protein